MKADGAVGKLSKLVAEEFIDRHAVEAGIIVRQHARTEFGIQAHRNLRMVENPLEDLRISVLWHGLERI